MVTYYSCFEYISLKNEHRILRLQAFVVKVTETAGEGRITRSFFPYYFVSKFFINAGWVIRKQALKTGNKIYFPFPPLFCRSLKMDIKRGINLGLKKISRSKAIPSAIWYHVRLMLHHLWQVVLSSAAIYEIEMA